MKYFGTLDRVKFEKEPTSKQDEILVLVEYFYKTMQVSFSANEAYKKPIKVPVKSVSLPTKLLLDAFYDFLIKRYDSYIDEIFVVFYNEFNDEVYGLTFAEQKKVALKYFNLKYKELKVIGVDKIQREVSNFGIENIKMESRLQYLSDRRNAFKKNVSIRNFLIEYLYGNSEFFSAELMNSDDMINEFVYFESQLKILISLNDKFKFEVDGFFTEAAKQKEIFEKYKELKWSFPMFEFIYYKCKSFTTDKYANANAFYVALKNTNSVSHKPKDYMDFVEEAFNIPMSKISYPKEHENRKHHEKVEFFSNEIMELEGEIS